MAVSCWNLSLGFGEAKLYSTGAYPALRCLRCVRCACAVRAVRAVRRVQETVWNNRRLIPDPGSVERRKKRKLGPPIETSTLWVEPGEQCYNPVLLCFFSSSGFPLGFSGFGNRTRRYFWGYGRALPLPLSFCHKHTHTHTHIKSNVQELIVQDSICLFKCYVCMCTCSVTCNTSSMYLRL